jgi:hypothetical protein
MQIIINYSALVLKLNVNGLYGVIPQKTVLFMCEVNFT